MRAKAFTLAELLVVIAVAAVLAALLTPTIAVTLEDARRTACAERQARLIGAALVFRADHRHRWPAVEPRPGDDALAPALGALELLVASTGGELGREDVACPGRPDHAPRLPASTEAARGATGWAWDARRDPTRRTLPGYAYDWSVPVAATVDRVVLADRGHHNHRDVVIAAWADGRVARLAPEPADLPPHPETTRTLDGAPALPTPNPLPGAGRTPDNLFDPVGDAGATHDHRLPGAGHPRRAFLR